jgi:O-antigen/teichoic acid export membrane protein
MTKKPASFISQILIYGSGLALNYGIGFILLPIYSRLMPTGQYGTLEILNRTIEIVSLLLLTQYGITYIRFFRDKADEEYRRRVTSTSMYIVTVIAGATAAVMILLRVPLSQLLFNTPDHGNYVVLVAVRYVFDMSFIVPLLYYQATEQPAKYIVVSTTRFATTLILNITLLTMMDDKVAAVLWAQILSVAIFFLTVGVWVFLHSARALDAILTKQILKFTWSFSFLGLFGFVVSSGDRFVLNKYCGESAVGVYSAGYRIAQMLSVIIFSPIVRAWSPRLVEQLRSADGPKQLARLTSVSVLLYCAAGLALSIYARELVSVFLGPNYYACYAIVPVIVLAYFFQGFALFVDGGIFYSKKTHLKIWHWVTTVVCVGLYFLLIPRYCGMGAAWAAVGTSIVLAGINWCIAVRVYPMKYEFGKLSQMLVIATVLYTANYLLEVLQMTYFADLTVGSQLAYPWLYLVLVGVLKLPLMLAFIGLVHWLGMIEPVDRQRLRNFLLKMRRRIATRTWD